jgi:ABC-2 type transport system ATP-binding protein
MKFPDENICLKASHLTKRYGAHTALKDLNLEVPAGAVLALLGPNGAGKTTTINLFLGFLKPSEGLAEVCGINSAVNPLAARRSLAYIPESVSLYGNLTAVENLRYFAELGGSKSMTNARCDELLLLAGLQENAFRRKCSTYSKGMRQKVCIALALAKEAKALLLDEPTSGLDPYASTEFLLILRKLSSQGIATLVATHDLYFAKQVADNIMILVNGELRREIEPDQLDLSELESAYMAEVSRPQRGSG